MKKITLFIFLALIIQATVSSQSCLQEGITFSSQATIDSFQTNYPNCTEILGGVMIASNDITNLNGLNVLTSIGGVVFFEHNPTLTSLTGLNNLTYIGGDLWIWDHDGFTNLEGLDNLTYIGQNLEIWFCDALTNFIGLDNLISIGGELSIRGNNALTSFVGLDNLTSISGRLQIDSNPILTSLTGLDNIDASSIYNLEIFYNSSLSTCEVQSVCEYLTSPNGYIEILENALGCNNQNEVEDACEIVGTQDINSEYIISIYPNPAQNELFISNKSRLEILEISIYNQLGQKVIDKTGENDKIDLAMLENGLYIVELVTNNLIFRERLIIN